MKIIQIIHAGEDNEMGYLLLGLSDDGKLYRWGRKDIEGMWRSGWILKKDEIND